MTGMPKVEPPADRAITTLYVGGVDPTAVTEKDLRFVTFFTTKFND